MNSENLLENLLIVGCGDLGRRLAERAAEFGYQTTGVRRQPPEKSPSHLTYVAADTAHLSQLERALASSFNVVVVTMTPSERSDEGYHRAYVQTCENLTTALQNQLQSPRLVLFVSSTGVYAQNDGSWVDETSVTEPERFNGKRLLEAEQRIAHCGFAHCIVRFSGIYGPGRNQLLNQVKQGRASLKARYSNRIHSEDCVGILLHLMERQRRNQPVDNLYVASDDEPAPTAEVVNWLSMKLGTNKARFEPDESNLGKRCSNQRLKATGYEFRYPDYRAGYTSVLEEGIG